MITRTFIKKTNTIVEKSKNNFGFNPICGLHYGPSISRFLVYFDMDKIKNEYENGNITKDDNVKHTLKMFNCGSIDFKNFNEEINGFCGSGLRKRATSFEIITFAVPCEWDSGIGFDSDSDFWFRGDSCVSNDGSNWEYAYNGKVWPNDEGIYSNDFLSREYVKFSNNEESLIISRQKFDKGNEDLNIDITKFIEMVINGEIENHGLCVSFSPLTESLDTETSNYVGFFNNNTNTFFEPYIETYIDKQIVDNRFNFALGKENNLLFTVNLGGELANLDELPTCNIDGRFYPVKQLKKGVYCACVDMSIDEYDNNTILYDIWSNIKISGRLFDDVEMEFVVNSSSSYYSFGKALTEKKVYSPMVVGVNNDELINQGEVREVKIYFKEEYTKNSYDIIDSSRYRIYVKDGNREVDVIYDYIEQIEDFNCFYIKSDELLPNTYYVDVEYTKNNEKRIYKNVLSFKVVNNATKIKK